MDKLCYYSLGLIKPFYPQFVLLGLLLFGKLKVLLKNKLVIFLLIISPAVLILVKIIRNDPFFLSDDFDHLRLVSENSYLMIVNHALSSKGIWVGHRIISGFFVFKLIFDIFSVNIYPYIIAIFLLHIVNIFLFYKFLLIIAKNSYFSLLGTFIFASIYLPWISNIHELLGGFFLLLTILAWIKYLRSKVKKYYYFAFVFYLSAILSKEITFLLPAALVLLTLYVHTNLFKVNLKREVVRFFPFLLVFVVYMVFVASGFSSYFGYESTSSYIMSYSLNVILANATHYVSLLIPWINKRSYYLVFILVSVAFDVYKKRLQVTPFVLIYLMFQAPSLFFVKRTSLYYLYYPSLFLLPAILLILKDIYFVVEKRYLRNNVFKRFFVSFYVVFIVFGIFGLGKKFMDDCFLIQVPWKNEKRASIYQVAERISVLSDNGELVSGVEIPIGDIKEKDDVINLVSMDILHLFIDDKEASSLRYNYNQHTDSIYVREDQIRQEQIR